VARGGIAKKCAHARASQPHLWAAIRFLAFDVGARTAAPIGGGMTRPGAGGEAKLATNVPSRLGLWRLPLRPQSSARARKSILDQTNFVPRATSRVNRSARMSRWSRGYEGNLPSPQSSRPRRR
jgi:hypothetical protein